MHTAERRILSWTQSLVRPLLNRSRTKESGKNFSYFELCLTLCIVSFLMAKPYPAHSIPNSPYTLIFHGGGTTHLKTLDNHPGAWHFKSNSTFVIGGDANVGKGESVRVSKIRGKSRKRPQITTQYTGGSRSASCPDNKVPPDYNNPEKMRRGQTTQQFQLCAKSYGITSIYSETTKKEELWAWFSPGNGPTGYRSSTLMSSSNEGKSWKKAYTMTKAVKNIIHPSFMSSGPGYRNTGLPEVVVQTNNGRKKFVDYWVYMTMTGYDARNPNKLSIQGAGGRSGKVYLCRQSRHKLGNSNVQCFVGGRRRWVDNNLAGPGQLKAVPIFANKDGVSWSGASLSYIPRNKKYLLITEHSVTMNGNLVFLEANKPWGPYRMVLRSDEFIRCARNGGSKAFFARHDPRWSHIYKRENPARRYQNREVLVYSGVLMDDAMKTVLFSLEKRKHGTKC